MILSRYIALGVFALAVAACAQQRDGSATAPPPPPDYDVAAKTQSDGVIRVTGFLPNEDELAHLHCAAAKQARNEGAAALEWVGGVAKYEGSRYAADLVYETTKEAAAVSLGAAADPADGGAAPVENWLRYCDEAGVPREGEA